MLNRYNEIEGFVRFPSYFDKIELDLFGNLVVTDRLIGKKREVEERLNVTGEIEVLLDLKAGAKWYRKASLMAFAFKGSRGPFLNMAERPVLYIDGDVKNIHPSNLIWSNEPPIETSGGFRLIPGFSRYLINRKGMVYDDDRECMQPNYLDNNGYVMFSIRPDVGRVAKMGMHRLLALAFLPYPANVDELDVNHIDGVKDNNDITIKPNLEWASRSRNCQHAYDNGLRSENKPILVKDLGTGVTTRYNSHAECGRALGIGSTTVDLRARSRGQAVFSDGRQYKREDDELEFRLFDSLATAIHRSGVNAKVDVTHIATGAKTTYNSVEKTAKALGINRATLGLRLRKTGTWENESIKICKVTTVVR